MAARSSARGVAEIFEEGTPIDRALQRAARTAAIEHKREGVPLVIWRDGEVVLVPPEEIEIPDEIE